MMWQNKIQDRPGWNFINSGTFSKPVRISSVNHEVTEYVDVSRLWDGKTLRIPLTDEEMNNSNNLQNKMQTIIQQFEGQEQVTQQAEKEATSKKGFFQNISNFFK